MIYNIIYHCFQQTIEFFSFDLSSEKHYCLVSKVSKEGFFASYLGPYVYYSVLRKITVNLSRKTLISIERLENNCA